MSTSPLGRVVAVSLVCGVLGGAGGALAMRLLLPEASPGAAPVAAAPGAAPVRPPEPPAHGPMLAAAPVAADRGEAQRELRAKMEALLARMEALEDLRARLEGEGVFVAPPPGEEAEPAPAEEDANSKRRRTEHEQFAKSLGLKGDRAKAFVETVGDVTRRIFEMERQHANKTVDGDTTTISIAGHAADADRLRGEFETFVERHLDAAERGRLTQSGEYASMLHRLGSQRRIITLRSANGQVVLRDEVRAVPGEVGGMAFEVSGPVGLKDMLLSDYTHLLR